MTQHVAKSATDNQREHKKTAITIPIFWPNEVLGKFMHGSFLISDYGYAVTLGVTPITRLVRL